MFREQMIYAKSVCDVVKVSEICCTRKGGARPRVAITFDDAFVSVYENALPILAELEMPCGVFVPVGNIGKKPNWPMAEGSPDRDQRVMTAAELLDVQSAGHECLSHTMSHAHVVRLAEAALRHELEESKRRLEDILGAEVSGVSYPFGADNRQAWDMARAVGYRFGVTVRGLSVDRSPDIMRVGRFKVLPSDPLPRFRLKLAGAYEVLALLRGALKCQRYSCGQVDLERR